MKKTIRTFALLAFAAAWSATTATAENKIDGQVFITTKGSQVFKLALVNVSLYPKEAVVAHVEAKDAANKDRGQQIDAMRVRAVAFEKEAEDLGDQARKIYYDHILDPSYEEAYRKIERKVDEARDVAMKWRCVDKYYRSSLYYFDGLPSAAMTTKTDADGKFSFVVPSAGSWVIRAASSRHVGDSTEYYSWLVSVDVQGSTNLMLANDNLFGVPSVESLVRNGTDDEYGAYKGMDCLRWAKRQLDAKGEETTRLAAEQAEQTHNEQLAKLPQLVKESQGRAIKKHPELAQAGSALNAKFVDAFRKLQTEQSSRLQEPDWPEKLAEECAGIRAAIAGR